MTGSQEVDVSRTLSYSLSPPAEFANGISSGHYPARRRRDDLSW